jgi:capsular polysaccharide biosynthesis protein
MILDTGTLVAILIALLGSITVIFISIDKQIKLEKEIRRLQLELRKQRTN